MPQPPAHNALGTPFVELQSVDSTNNYARNLIHEGLAQHGTAIFAHEQVAGKGQRGKIWSSEKGVNVILSLVLNPQSLLLSQQFQLNACVAVSVQEFFMKYAGEETSIKWPNDLYWQDRKAGGILIESIVRSQQSSTNNAVPVSATWEWTIAGIGININQTAFPSYLSNPVSLKQITGKNFDTLLLAKEICETLTRKFETLITDGFDTIYQQYLAHLYKINATVKLRKDNRVFEATIKGVSRYGRLIVQHAVEEQYDFGDIEWVI